MDITDPDNNQYLQMAIQTVIYLNRDHIDLNLDASRRERFIKDMSVEIMSRAQRFKNLTLSNMEALHKEEYV